MHRATVFKDRIWLVGGVDNNADYKNDVWSSADGAQWVLAVGNAPWKGRCMHSLETFNHKLWIIGGRSNLESTFEKLFNDVWYSDDGVSWSEVT